jgi:hypothetical protein
VDEHSLVTHFSFISGLSGRYGSWGALENQFFQFPPYYPIAPKYQALLDNVNAGRPTVSLDMVGADAVVWWPSVPGADAYGIYRSETPHGPFVFLGSTVDTMFVDVNAGLNPTRFYRVTSQTLP